MKTLPQSIIDATFIVICSGESYSTHIVIGDKLLNHLAECLYGDANYPQTDDSFGRFISRIRDVDNWHHDADLGPVHWMDDVGETDRIDVYRITHHSEDEIIKTLKYALGLWQSVRDQIISNTPTTEAFDNAMKL